MGPRWAEKDTGRFPFGENKNVKLIMKKKFFYLCSINVRLSWQNLKTFKKAYWTVLKTVLHNILLKSHTSEVKEG